MSLCRWGRKTEHQCPNEATVFDWNGEPDTCAFHEEFWAVRSGLEEAEHTLLFLNLWGEQSEHMGIEMLTDAMRFIRAEAELRADRLRKRKAEMDAEGEALERRGRLTVVE